MEEDLKILNYRGLAHLVERFKRFFIKNPKNRGAGKYLRCIDSNGNVEWAIPSYPPISGTTVVTYYNTSSNDSGEGLHIYEITKKFFGASLSNGLVSTRGLSTIGLSQDTARSILNGDIKSVILAVPGERTFLNDDDIDSYIPANVLLDTSDYNSCLIVAQGYKMQHAKVIESNTTSVVQSTDNITYGSGLSPILYCINLIYDDVQDSYAFYGFAIYPSGNFGLFGESDTID